MTQLDLTNLIGSDTLMTFGSQIRSVDESENHFAGIVVPFTDETAKDLYETFFNARTYYGAHKGNGMDVMINHGYPLRAEVDGEIVEFEEFAGRILKTPIRVTETDEGLFGEVWFDLADEFEKKLAEAGRAGKLYFSSGALSHGPKSRAFEIDSETGEVKRWIIGEVSLTPTPGTPKKRTLIQPVRALVEPPTPMATTTTVPEGTVPAVPAGANEAPDTAPEVRAAADSETSPNDAVNTAVRAALLGEYLEASIATDVLGSINRSLYWKVCNILYSDDKSIDQMIAELPPIFDEHKSLAITMIEAIVRSAQSSADAATAIRALFPKEDEATRAAKVLASAHKTSLTEARDKIQTVLDADDEKTTARSAEEPVETPAEATPETVVESAEVRSAEAPAEVPAAKPKVRLSPEQIAGLAKSVK